MEGYDQDLGRLFYRSHLLPGGMNTSLPKMDVPPEASTNMSGCLTSLGHIIPAYDATTEKWATKLSETPRHLFIYYGYLDTLVLCGNEKVWVVTTGDPVDRTPTPDFTSQTYSLWRGQTLIHQGVPVAVINNYGIDKLHYYDGGSGSFAILTNCPLSRAFTGWYGRLLVANSFISSAWYVNRISWSEVNDITSWPYTGSSGYLDIDDDSDAILRVELTVGNLLVIFRRKSIYLGLPNADMRNPLFAQHLSSKGIRAPNSVQKSGSDLYYMGDNDILKISGGAAPVSVGMPIRTELFPLADPATISYSWSFMDTVNNLYYLVVRQLDTTWRAWILNIEQNSWSFQDFSGKSSLGEWYA